MRSFVRAALEDDASSTTEGSGAVEPIEVVEARSGFEALRLLPRGPYDCVITDINMPDINGLELVSFIRKSEHHRQTPLIIISTQSAERDRQRGIALGADSWLAKPFEPAELRDLVRTHLATARARAVGRGSAEGGSR